MKLLKNVTLLTLMLGTPIVGVNQNIVSAGDFTSEVSAIISRAIKTDIIDLTELDFDSLTKKQCQTLFLRLENAFENPYVEELSLPEHIGTFDTIENKSSSVKRQPVSILLGESSDSKKDAEDISDYTDEELLEMDEAELKELYRGPFIAENCISDLVDEHNEGEHNVGMDKFKPYTHGKNQYLRKQIMKTIETAYDSGYVDFSEIMDVVEADPSIRYNRTTVYASLFEIGFNSSFGGGNECSPTTVIVGKDTDLTEGIVAKLKKYLNENFPKAFKFTKETEVKEKYLKTFCEYFKKTNIIDLTAIDLDSLTENELEKLVDELSNGINDDTHLIYYKNMNDHLFKQSSKDFFEGALASDLDKDHQHKISLNERYRIAEKISFINQTGSIVLDDISLPIVSKIRLHAQNNVANGKGKVKLKIYADFSGHEDLKKMLKNDENIDIEFGLYDNVIHKKIEGKCISAISSGVIKFDKGILNSDESKQFLNMIKAYIEYYLSNHLYEEKINLAIPVYKNTEEEDEKLFKKFKGLESKYKNLKVIMDRYD